MATGVYGNTRGADVAPSDMEIFYQYTPNRGTPSGEMIRLNPENVISRIPNPNGNGIEVLDGLYTLNLPASEFTQKGIYTIIIRPTEIRLNILDCGVLSNMSDIKGIVLNKSDVPNNFIDKFNNGNLVGYRVSYLDEQGERVPNLFRLITSNNTVKVVTGGNNDNGITQTYQFDSTSNLVFCTLTPSSASEVKPNILPYIGNVNDSVIITNTYFNPIMIELEMVEHDIETLAYGIFGNQSKSVEDGIYTVYNFNNEIYAQWDMYEIKDQFRGKPLFEIRERRDSIDFTKQFNNVISTD